MLGLILIPKLHSDLRRNARIIDNELNIGLETLADGIQRQQATRSLSRDWSDATAAFQDPELACLFVRLGNARRC